MQRVCCQPENRVTIPTSGREITHFHQSQAIGDIFTCLPESTLTNNRPSEAVTVPDPISQHARIIGDRVPLLGTSSADRKPLSGHCLYQTVAHCGEKHRRDRTRADATADFRDARLFPIRCDTIIHTYARNSLRTNMLTPAHLFTNLPSAIATCRMPPRPAWTPKPPKCNLRPGAARYSPEIARRDPAIVRGHNPQSPTLRRQTWYSPGQP
jgi:hypothetical protein